MKNNTGNQQLKVSIKVNWHYGNDTNYDEQEDAKTQLTVSIMTTKKQDAGVLLNKSTRDSPSENFMHYHPPEAL